MAHTLRVLFALAAVLALALATAVGCTREVVKEVPVIVEKEVVREVEVAGETVVVEKQVIKEVPVEVVVEKEVVREVEVPVERVVEKEVVREIEKPVIVEREIVKEVVKEVVVERDFEGPNSVHLRASSAVQSMNPYTSVSGYVGLIGEYIFSFLVQPDNENFKWVPDLAERWEVAPDGSSYTFFLRQAAHFADGTPVTAKDVKWSYETRIDPRTKGRAGTGMSMIKGVTDFMEGKSDEVVGIVAVDDQTIRFDMEFPTGLFMNHAWREIYPSHVFEGVALDKLVDHPFWTSNDMFGSGPYKMAKIEPDQFHEMTANPDYYFGKPKIERVFAHLIKSPDSTQIALQRGEIDVVRRGQLSPHGFEAMLADPRFQVVGTQGNQEGFSFNSRTDWISDPRVRQAWMYALDRKALCDTFRGGVCTFHNTSVNSPPGVYTQEMIDRYPLSGDPEKARMLLAEAGWDSDREVVCKSPTYSGARLAQIEAELAQLADVGIKIKLEMMETPIWAAVYYENYNYDCVRVGGWGSNVAGINYYFHSKNTNAMGYASAELDALLDAVPRALTVDERAEIGQKMNELFIEDLPIIPVFSGAMLHAYHSNLFIPGWGKRPQPDQIGDIMITPRFAYRAEFRYHVEDWEWEGPR